MADAKPAKKTVTPEERTTLKEEGIKRKPLKVRVSTDKGGADTYRKDW